MLDRMPQLVGVATLAAGATLVAAPGTTTRALGLEGEEAAVRVLGAADLLLVPGLLAGRPRWPWMAARAALNLAQAGWLAAAAGRAGSPGLARGGAVALAALTTIDGPTAAALRRAGA